MVVNKKAVLLLISVFISTACFAQKESKDVKRGNKFYEQEKYVESEVEYRKGLEKNAESFSGTFNLGNALYRQEKYPEAAAQFQKAVSHVDGDKSRLAASYHNMGNALLKAEKIPESIEAYKQALRANPKDDETRTNLAYAQTLLQQQQQNQQQQNQNQDQQQKEQQQQQQNQQQNQEQEQQQQEQQSNPEEMSKENAEQILNAFLQDEKDVQDKVKEQQMQQNKRYRVTKDW